MRKVFVHSDQVFTPKAGGKTFSTRFSHLRLGEGFLNQVSTPKVGKLSYFPFSAIFISRNLQITRILKETVKNNTFILQELSNNKSNINPLLKSEKQKHDPESINLQSKTSESKRETRDYRELKLSQGVSVILVLLSALVRQRSVALDRRGTVCLT